MVRLDEVFDQKETDTGALYAGRLFVMNAAVRLEKLRLSRLRKPRTVVLHSYHYALGL